MNNPRRGRLKFIALAALFIVPLLVAWLWFVNVDRFAPGSVGAHGDLITPARPLGEFELPSVDGHDVVSDATLHGRWAVVHVGTAACDAECREALWESRQVHTRLGRDGVRVQRVYLVVGAGGVDDPGFFAAEHPTMLLARIDRADPLAVHFEPGYTYLVDPLGNLMMRYPPEATPQHLHDDLKRLLRVSRIG